MKVRSEPVVVPAALTGLVQAVLNVLVVFGVPLSAEQLGAVNTLICAVYVALAFWARSKVTPV